MLLMIENAIGIGLQTVGLGMAFVIGIIAVLFLVLKILIPIFQKINDMGSGKKPAKEEKAQPQASAVSAAPVQNDDESEIVAAIIAAISAETGKAPSSFRVVSFKRIK